MTVTRNALLSCALSLPTIAVAAPPPPPLDAYGELPGVEDMALSPDGKGVAILGRVDAERRLLVVVDGKLRANASVGDVKVRSVDWAGNEHVMLVTSATVRLGFGFLEAKHEFYTGVIVPLDGSAPQQVFGKTASMARAIWGNYGSRQIDGKRVGYFGGLELQRGIHGDYVFDKGEPALFSLDLKTNRPRKVAAASGESHWRDWIVDYAGNVAATFDIGASDGRWTIVNAQGKRIASGVNPEGDVSLVSLGQDGTSVIYSREEGDKTSIHWMEVPLAGGEAKPFLDEVPIRRIYVDPDTSRILGYLPRGADTKPVLFDPAKQKVLRSVYRAFPNRQLSIKGWSQDFGRLLVATNGNGDSGTWYTVDMAKLSASPVGNERPRIAREQVGPISSVTYEASDGTELDGVLTLPPGRDAKNLPAVMLPHGGPQAYDEVSFDWWAQAMASRGYAVFQPNFRGSTHRDNAFRRAGYGQWGRKMQTDISDGLAELVKRGVVDPKRVCIVGASYGGYAALAGVTLQNGLYRCSVAVAGVSDLTDMYSTSYRESADNRMVKRSMLESLGDPKRFPEVSPRRNATRADAPVLLIHGKDDTVVPFNQSQAMADALRSAGKPYELVTLGQEDHWLSRSATRKQMLEAAMAFVQKNNPAD